MSVAYFATAWNTNGTAVTNAQYKDLAITVATGDLVVVVCIGADNGTGTGNITTQSGTALGTWQSVSYVAAAGSCSNVAGYNVATGSGSVTVRAQVPTPTAPQCPIGVAIWVVPAAEWTGTPAFTTVPNNDTDGQVSVTVGNTPSFAFYCGGDWSAAAPGSVSVPSGAIEDTTYSDGTQYGIAARHWTDQASGTRNYGPSGAAGTDWNGRVIVVQQVTGPPPVPDEGSKWADATRDMWAFAGYGMGDGSF